jgi:tRNA dimethylallyltransferase
MLIPIITGPTGVGKTAISIELYNKYNIEIISADAFQVYKYMDIGTSKPDRRVLDSVPHHLIDILEPHENYSAALFVEHSQKLIEKILNKDKLPLIVGGTALYIDRLVKGIFNDLTVDYDIRSKISMEGLEKGFDSLYNKLVDIDSAYASKISKNDHVRIIRALEVYEKFKKPYSTVITDYHKSPKYKYKVFFLQKNRDEIYKIVEKRIDEMFNIGWIEEVKSLLEMGCSLTYHSFKAIGYREIVEFLYGEYSLKEAMNRIKKRTRNFVKRQFTFFKKLDYVENISDKILIDNFFKIYYKDYYRY